MTSDPKLLVPGPRSLVPGPWSLVNPPLIVLSGASGSGKTTLCRMIADRLGFFYSVSHTTRPKRPGEKDGHDYHFVNRAQFDKMIEKGDFLEWSEVYGNLYGTLREPVLAHAGKGMAGVILDVDPQGALKIRKELPRTVLIFVLVPSLSDLETRLAKRGSESPEIRKKRLEESKKEEAYKKYYNHVVINQDIEQAFGEIKKIIECSHRK
ncbi:MAG: guanylate kinase [Deltaproteobacteria bacterium]|nr:guanylate kinase [Deltaproteobacteria bacterium]